MSYTHAGGIDRPLVITKGSTSILPHQNWRGQFSSGTYANGARSDCPAGVTTGCTPIAWPGWRTTAWHEDVTEPDIRVWWGGLVDGMRDASGQQYMRNRYYDPATGQFTQPDPIGIAGGLNSYGFAAGDPVTYSDPYGLAPDTIHAMNDAANEALGAMAILALLALNSDDGQVVAAGQEILTLLNDLHSSTENVYFLIDPHSGRSSTGPMNDGSGIGSLVNPNQSTKRPIPVRGAHELGHAWAIISLGANDPNNSDHRRIQNRESLRFENAMRTIYGCTHRRVHGTDSRFQNPACRFTP